jgi:hypothetical protein
VVPQSRFVRIDLPVTAGIQDVFRRLVNDLDRTEAIVAEVKAAFEQARMVLLLTDRIEHLEVTFGALKTGCCTSDLNPPSVFAGSGASFKRLQHIKKRAFGLHLRPFYVSLLPSFTPTSD